MGEYILGAITMLIGIVTGHVLAKPWLDKRLNKPKPPQQGGPTI